VHVGLSCQLLLQLWSASRKLPGAGNTLKGIAKALQPAFQHLLIKLEKVRFTRLAEQYAGHH
jgi:hypothetical protein